MHLLSLSLYTPPPQYVGPYGPPRHILIGSRCTAAMKSVIAYNVQVVVGIVVAYHFAVCIPVGVRRGVDLLKFLNCQS